MTISPPVDGQQQRFQGGNQLVEDQQVLGKELDLYKQHFWDTNIWNTALGLQRWAAPPAELTDHLLTAPVAQDPAVV